MDDVDDLELTILSVTSQIFPWNKFKNCIMHCESSECSHLLAK